VLGIVRGTQESCRDGPVARTVTRICRCDLLVVDDIGGPQQAEHDAAEAFYLLIDLAGSLVVVTAQKSVN
jgi:DNA replication protein DnaC